MCKLLAFLYLHSIMFLLIPRLLTLSQTAISIFTFHNVSINTIQEMKAKIEAFPFTFHNVSINTKWRGVGCCGNRIYIP